MRPGALWEMTMNSSNKPDRASSVLLANNSIGDKYLLAYDFMIPNPKPSKLIDGQNMNYLTDHFL
jgi:hypothetical protein